MTERSPAEAGRSLSAGRIAVVSSSRSSAEALARGLTGNTDLTIVPVVAGERAPILDLLSVDPALILVDARSASAASLRRFAALSTTIVHGASSLDEDVVRTYSDLGVSCVVERIAPLHVFRAIVAAFAAGNSPQPSGNHRLLVRQRPFRRPPGVTAETITRLTKRERELALLAARGASNAELASMFAVSASTVKNHLHHVFSKLGVHGREDLRAVFFD